MNNEEQRITSDKILDAATILFTKKHFDAVSIREIGHSAGVNSALISYYFGGKKQLYCSVISRQADIVQTAIDGINKQAIDGYDKIVSFVKTINTLQMSNRNQIALIYRELLTPSNLCDDYINTRLLTIHSFLISLISEAKNDKKLREDINTEHIAFTIEGLIILFFITADKLPQFNIIAANGEDILLSDILRSYLLTLKPLGGASQ